MEYTIMISAGTILVSAGISWGMITTKMKYFEKKIEEQQERIEEMRKDHDLIIKLDTKVDGIFDTLKEMKTMMERKAKRQ